MLFYKNGLYGAMKVISPCRTVQKNLMMFGILHLSIFTLGLLPLFWFSKLGLCLKINQWHHPILDRLIPYLTYIGDGWLGVAFIVIATLYYNNYRKTLILGGSFLTMTITIQFLKRFVFSHVLRPVACLPIKQLHLVQGVALSTHLSFPSGHAGTIFTIISISQLLANHPHWSYVIWYPLAILVAYSRLYLCQHFYIDIYVGALIGTLSSIVAYTIGTTLSKPDWLDQPIYSYN